jgi:hypothetical protein
LGLIFLSDHQRLAIDSIPVDGSFYFCGPAIDDRGRGLRNKIEEGNNASVIEIFFDIEDYSVSINGDKSSIRNSNQFFSEVLGDELRCDIFVDITTLGFVELLLILKWFKISEYSRIFAIYTEPQFYKNRADYMSDFGRHEFDLTSHSGGFKAIPGFTRAISTDDKATLIAILGFERSRLGQLLQLDEGAYIKNIIPVFGTPSFKVGWDKHCFFQNVETLKENSRSPNFVAAYSALDMLEILEYVKDSLPDGEVAIAPFGSKPLSLGAAIFLTNNPNITLKYDHPIKKSERSEGVGRVHLFLISKDED